MAVKESVRGQTNSRIKIPKQYQVLIYNDDFYPYGFCGKSIGSDI